MPRAFELDLDRQFHIMFLSTTRCNGGRPLSSLAVVFLGILSSVYAQDRTTEQGEAQITGELAFFNFSQNVWSCIWHTNQPVKCHAACLLKWNKAAVGRLQTWNPCLTWNTHVFSAISVRLTNALIRPQPGVHSIQLRTNPLPKLSIPYSLATSLNPSG